jgi:hypothetical protein
MKSEFLYLSCRDVPDLLRVVEDFLREHEQI